MVLVARLGKGQGSSSSIVVGTGGIIVLDSRLLLVVGCTLYAIIQEYILGGFRCYFLFLFIFFFLSMLLLLFQWKQVLFLSSFFFLSFFPVCVVIRPLYRHMVATFKSLLFTTSPPKKLFFSSTHLNSLSLCLRWTKKEK
jgi:hypothetical protein